MKLLALLAGVILVRLACQLAVPAPYILTDELLYAKLARAFWEGNPMEFRGTPIAFPSFLYPLAISPASIIADPLATFRAIQVLNALLFVLAAIPLYLLAKRLLGPASAPWATGLALFPPYGLQSAVAMSENLFFPLVTWVAYLLVEAATRPEARWRYGLAAAMGLAFITKPHGMTVVPAAVLATWAAARLLGRSNPAPRGPVWGPLALYGACLVAAISVIGSLPGGHGPFDLTRLLGTYAEGLTGRRPFEALPFAASALGNFAAVAAAVGFLPLVVFLGYAARALRIGPPEDRVLALWTLVTGALLIAITARHTVILDHPARIHERYTFYLEPLILLAGWKAAASAKLRAFEVAGACGLAVLALVFAQKALGTLVVADTLTFSAIRPVVEILGAKPALLALGAAAVSLIYWGARALRQGRPRLAGGVLAGYLTGLTGLALVSQHYAALHAASRVPLAHFVQDSVSPDRVLAIVSAPDHLPDQLMIEYLARNPVRVFFDGVPQHHMNDAPLGRRDGELVALSALPDGSAILAADSLSIGLPVIGATRDLVLYEKRGTVRETQTVTGVYEDGWTSGRCVITDARPIDRALRARLTLRLDTTSVPASLFPLGLIVRDGTGRTQRFKVHAGPHVPSGAIDVETLETTVERAPGRPYQVTVEVPTWSPAEAHGARDSRRLGVVFRGAIFRPSP